MVSMLPPLSSPMGEFGESKNCNPRNPLTEESERSRKTACSKVSVPALKVIHEGSSLRIVSLFSFKTSTAGSSAKPNPPCWMVNIDKLESSVLVARMPIAPSPVPSNRTEYMEFLENSGFS